MTDTVHEQSIGHLDYHYMYGAVHTTATRVTSSLVPSDVNAGYHYMSGAVHVTATRVTSTLMPPNVNAA